MEHRSWTNAVTLCLAIVLARWDLGAAEARDPREAVRKEVLPVISRLLKPALTPLGQGKAWVVEVTATVGRRGGKLVLAWDGAGRHAMDIDAPGLASVKASWSPSGSWLFVPEHSVLFKSSPASPVPGSPLERSRLWKVVKAQLAAALLTAQIASLPEKLELEKTADGIFQARAGTSWKVDLSGSASDGPIEIALSGPVSARVKLASARNVDAAGIDSWMVPPPSGREEKVDDQDLRDMLPAAVDLLCEKLLWQARPELVPSPLAHLPRVDGRAVLVLRGTPEDMGRQYGLHLKDALGVNIHRILHGIGIAETVRSGKWFPGTLAEIWEKQKAHIPERYVREMDAIAEAAGIPRDKVRHANLFPERFHCSGAALRGAATEGGKLLHARILDYMTEVGFQASAVCTVMAPEGRHAWINVGYVGCIGSVTGMNEKGLAMGEMGGRGEGHLDGIPMTFLVREVLERFETTDDAVAWIRSVPRTCEYFYVISDARTRGMAGIASYARSLAAERGTGDLEVIRPGDSHPLLPHGMPDAVLMSAGGRYSNLVDRVKANYGKITPEIFWGILGKGVAMSSALHIAIFMPETLELWVAEASLQSEPAYTQPIAKLNLRALLSQGAALGTSSAAGF